MVELDPKIVDQDKIRIQRRKRLFKILVIPLILLVLVGLYILRTGAYNISFSFLYSNQDYDNAKNISHVQDIANAISPYLTHYNIGVVQLQKGQPEEAEASFRESLKKSPPKDKLCMVYVNLSLSIELQADQRRDNKDYDEAISLYNTAETILYENNCASRVEDGSNKDQAAQDAKKRLIEKRTKSLAEKNELKENDGQGGDSKKTEELRDSIMTPKDYDAIKKQGNTKDIMNGAFYGRRYGSSGSGSGSVGDGITW